MKEYFATIIFLLEVEQDYYRLSHLIIMFIVPMGEYWSNLIYGLKYFQDDDEQTLEEDEALITKEERQEELAALHSEMDLPIEELLKRYAGDKGDFS